MQIRNQEERERRIEGHYNEIVNDLKLGITAVINKKISVTFEDMEQQIFDSKTLCEKHSKALECLDKRPMDTIRLLRECRDTSCEMLANKYAKKRFEFYSNKENLV